MTDAGGYVVEVTGLSREATEKDVHDFFAFSGAIDNVEIVRSGDYAACTAYVTFRDAYSQETAVLLSGATILDQRVCITRWGRYDDEFDFWNKPSTTTDHDQHQPEHHTGQFSTSEAVTKAQEVVTTMLSVGYVLGKDALTKAKEFDESHQVSATATAKVAEFTERIGLADKLFAGMEAVKTMDDKYHVSETTKTAVSATARSAASAASTMINSSYFSKGALWVSGALNRAANLASDLGSKGEEETEMEEVSIRVPYKNLKKDVEVEMASVGDDELSPNQRIELNSEGGDGSNFASPAGDTRSQAPEHCSLVTLVLSCTVAAGVQFGWALQLSLLTPYIQASWNWLFVLGSSVYTLGIGHAFSSFIWLCGPITGLVVQPCVGIWSDKCSSKYGRRRPFILAGSLMISIAVIIIGFSADIGYLLGDTKEHCSTFKGTRTRAAIIFVIGFWMLDLANNTVQGPARALLADFAGPDQRNTANAIFCLWMAVGNVLGYSAGASGSWNRWFPFLMSRACCEACGNLKAAFLVAVVFLTLCTLVTLYFADEVPLSTNHPNKLSDSAPLLRNGKQNGIELSKSDSHDKHVGNPSANGTGNGYEKLHVHNHSNPGDDASESFDDGPGAVMVKLLTSLRHLPPGMHAVLVVMALTWLSWFPFFLFDTDWMGREVYHGDPKGDANAINLYDQGVREGAFGLLLNSVVLGISSFLIEPMCQKFGARLVWAMSNYIVFACMATTAVISLVSWSQYSRGIEHVIGGNSPVKIASLIVFTLLGFPLAITFSVPFSVTAQLTADSGGGQGLAIGVLNLAIVVPQMIVSLGAGPWDALFGGGNIPAFVLASISAFAAGVIAMFKLPNLSSSFQSTGMHFG
ncbi:Sucrose transport protein SUC3 [Linum perenne]